MGSDASYSAEPVTTVSHPALERGIELEVEVTSLWDPMALKEKDF